MSFDSIYWPALYLIHAICLKQRDALLKMQCNLETTEHCTVLQCSVLPNGVAVAFVDRRKHFLCFRRLAAVTSVAVSRATTATADRQQTRPGAKLDRFSTRVLFQDNSI